MMDKNITIINYHDLAHDKLDILFTSFSMVVGLPANILIFLAFRSYPNGASKYLFRLLAIADAISIFCLFTQRPLMWFGILQFENKRTSVILTIYLNIIYYVNVFTNIILVFVLLERLLYCKYPQSHTQYFGDIDRVKLTLIIQGLLIMVFCLIITIKMSYFGVAWTVVFLTFYVIAPSCCLATCIALIIKHYYIKYLDRKFLERNKPLSASHSSFIDRISTTSHHSHLLAASGSVRGSANSAKSFSGSNANSKKKRKDPYALYPSDKLITKSVSESHLIIAVSKPDDKIDNVTNNTENDETQNQKSTSTTIKKSKSGNCLLPVSNVAVSLKVPSQPMCTMFTSSPTASLHSLYKTGDNSNNQNALLFLTEEQEEQFLLKKWTNKQLTLMACLASCVVLLCTIPLCVCSAGLMKEEMVDFDLSDDMTYLMITAIMVSMYIIHSCKIFLYCLVSNVFRRHAKAVFTRKQQQLIDQQAEISVH